MNEKLKKCPFCGGNAQFTLISVGHEGYHAIWNFQVRCSKCGARVPLLHKLEIGINTDGYLAHIVDERDDAIKEWNRRSESE